MRFGGLPGLSQYEVTPSGAVTPSGGTTPRPSGGSGSGGKGSKTDTTASEFQSLFDSLMPIEAEERRYQESLKLIGDYYGDRAALTEEDDELRLKLAEEHQQKIDEINGIPALMRKLEEMQDAYKTELELEQEQYDEKLTQLEEFRENELVTQEEYNDLLQNIEQEHQDELTRIEKEGLTAREKFQRMSLQNQVSTVVGELANITSGVAQHNKTLFALNKAAGIAQATISTYEGVSKTLASYPWSIAGVLAAAHLAAGIAQVSAIASTSFNGGGSGSAPSIAGTTSATAVSDVSSSGGSAQGRSLTLYGFDKGSLYSGEEIAKLLNEYVADGGTIYMK